MPKQNIALTSDSDIMFENNVGLIDRVENMVNIPRQEEELERLKAMPKEQRTGLLSKQIQQDSYLFNTPENILKKSHRDAHNEIIVIGKPNVNIQEFIPATQECKITGLFLIQAEPNRDHLHTAEFKGEKILDKEAQLSLFLKHAPDIAKNLNVPILFINGKYFVRPTN